MAKKNSKPVEPVSVVEPSPVTTSHPEPLAIETGPEIIDPVVIEAVADTPDDAVVVDAVDVPESVVLHGDSPERISRAESDRRKFGRAV